MLISEILGFEIIAVAIKVEFVARQKKGTHSNNYNNNYNSPTVSSIVFD